MFGRNLRVGEVNTVNTHIWFLFMFFLASQLNSHISGFCTNCISGFCTFYILSLGGNSIGAAGRPPYIEFLHELNQDYERLIFLFRKELNEIRNSIHNKDPIKKTQPARTHPRRTCSSIEYQFRISNHDPVSYLLQFRF
jgi:hypothetical protein